MAGQDAYVAARVDRLVTVGSKRWTGRAEYRGGRDDVLGGPAAEDRVAGARAGRRRGLGRRISRLSSSVTLTRYWIIAERGDLDDLAGDGVEARRRRRRRRPDSARGSIEISSGRIAAGGARRASASGFADPRRPRSGVSTVVPSELTLPCRKFCWPTKPATYAVAGVVVDGLGVGELLDPAGAHDRDPVAHRSASCLVVGDEDEGDPEAGLEELRARAASPRAAGGRGRRSGSSSSRTPGRFTSARASATRCCWPPESWAGLAAAKSSMRTIRSAPDDPFADLSLGDLA